MPYCCIIYLCATVTGLLYSQTHMMACQPQTSCVAQYWTYRSCTHWPPVAVFCINTFEVFVLNFCKENGDNSEIKGSNFLYLSTQLNIYKKRTFVHSLTFVSSKYIYSKLLLIQSNSFSQNCLTKSRLSDDQVFIFTVWMKYKLNPYRKFTFS